MLTRKLELERKGFQLERERLLSIAELAELLNISQATVRSWILNRRVEFVRVGRRIQFKPDTVQNIIDAGTVGTRKGESLV